MDSWYSKFASVAAATKPFNAEATGVDWMTILGYADWSLFAVGCGVVIGALIRWLRGGRADPLGSLADRPNRLMPEGTLLPVVVFLLSASGLQLLAERMFEGDALEISLWHVGTGAQLLGGLACVWVGALFFEGGAGAFLRGDRQVGRDLIHAVLYLLAAMPICAVVFYATENLVIYFWPAYDFPEHEAIETLRSGRTPAWTLWLGTVVIAPFAEECFFRGVLVTMLRNLLRSRWLVVVGSGFVFGMAHAQQPHVIPALTVLGVLLGVLYLRTGSLIGPTVLHVLFNCKTVLWETLMGLAE